MADDILKRDAEERAADGYTRRSWAAKQIQGLALEIGRGPVIDD